MANVSGRIYLQSVLTSSTTFLYQTRTLQPLSQSHLAQSIRAISTKRDGSDYEQAPVPSNSHATSESLGQMPDHAPPRRASYLRRRGGAMSHSKLTDHKPLTPKRTPKSKKTMTRTERDAFGGLMARLAHEQKHQASRAEVESPGQLQQSEDLNGLMKMFDSILQTSNTTPREAGLKRKPSGDVPSGSSNNRHDHSSDPQERHSHESQGIRLSELGFLDASSGSGVDPIVSTKEAINMVVGRESKKIESELFNAIEQGKGDSGLWEVCKQRIFTMIGQFGAVNPVIPVDQGSNADTSVEQSPNPKHPSGPLDIPDAVPPGPIIAKLYPQLLLLAFRILGTHFPESPLIGQFRTAVQANGRTFAFLGTSQPLYEELISFHWRTCYDLPAVVSFLRDMDTAGLDPSRRVRKILREIVRQREQDLESNQKAGDGSFWDAPPNRKAFDELAGPGGWMETIKSRRRQRPDVTIPVLKL